VICKQCKSPLHYEGKVLVDDTGGDCCPAEGDNRDHEAVEENWLCRCGLKFYDAVSNPDDPKCPRCGKSGPIFIGPLE
jgi:hypothetical protein